MYHQLSQGAIQTEGQIAATAGVVTQVTSGVAKALQATSAAVSAIPIVGSIVGGIADILQIFHVGEGCGQACISSSETEQVFEAAADNVYYAVKAGQISSAQGVAAIQWLQEQGDAQMAQLAQTDSQAKAGQANMDKTLLNEIASVQSLNVSAPTQPLNPTQLEQSLFIQPGASGWYPQSIAAAASLALQAIADATGVTSTGYAPGYAGAPGATASLTIGGAAGDVLGELTSGPGLLVIGAVVLGFLIFRGRKNAG